MPTYVFHHIHLASPDPEKTAEFYERMFGARKSILDLGGGRRVVSVDLHGTPILIRAKAEGEADKPSLDHFGIRTDDLDQAVAELKGQGVKFTQEVTPLRPGTSISFLRTPDGVVIELLQSAS